jgi:uncharacterized damage-inducible protein DinB
MTTINLLTELHTANHWANQTLLAQIPEELFAVEAKGSFPSIKATYTHIWDAQNIWYYRLNGEPNTPMPSKTFEGSYNQLQQAILTSSSNYINLLAGKTDDYLQQMLHYTNLQGKEFTQPIYQILVQVTHHSAMHRGQVITTLRQLGYTEKLPQTDVIAWYRLNS